ncbi:MAG: hypothetical protein AB7N91_08070 [Candidatus Tectimicrobiota bacterium]
MQTRAQSTLEVGVDFLCSLLVNIGGQCLLYGAAATVTRVTFFSSLFLALVFIRRLAMRRFFEALTPLGTRQSRFHSALEALSDTVAGWGIAVVLQLLIYQEATTLLRAGLGTVGLYGLTMLRRYSLRRLFAAYAARLSSSGPNVLLSELSS